MTPFSIDSIHIQALHRKNYLSYRLPFKDNWLVINAPNGVGKTTILRILYYYLSGQWEKLSAAYLKNIGTHINEELISYYEPLKPASKRVPKEQQAIYRERYRTKLLPQVFDDLFSNKIKDLKSDSVEIAQEISAEYDAHYPLLLDVIKEVVGDIARTKAPPIQGIEVLFLPTYRRIEHVVNEVFPSFSERLATRLMSKVRALSIQHDYEEGDVEATKKSVLSVIEEYWSSQYSTESFNSISYELTYQHIVGFGMQDVAEKVKEFGLQAAQYVSDAEHRIVLFRTICDDFLEDKQLHYDESDHRMRFSIPRYGSGKTHPLEKLSSGEKQIVSLFAHLIFSEKPVFLILDEPELSLSTSWQKKMMDKFYELRSKGVLAGLLVATHSDVILKEGAAYAKELDQLRISNAY